jgi:hypothetical protein
MGFVAFFMPSGIGVRDIALQVLLAVELRSRVGPDGYAIADGVATIVALLFRLIGTLAELIIAGLMWRFAPPAARAAVREEVEKIEVENV